MTESMKKAGRPRGAPSKVLPVRIPEGMIERLDRYLDWAESRTGLRSNRNEAIRQALGAWLDEKEVSSGMAPRPAWADIPSARQQWRAAYNAVSQKQAVVRIDRIRKALNWPPEAFDQMIATLVSEGRVDLHRGKRDDPDNAEKAAGYCDADGTIYLSISWQNKKSISK